MRLNTIYEWCWKKYNKHEYAMNNNEKTYLL